MENSRQSAPTIMVVEDDLELAALIAARLEKEGYAVFRETNGLDAVGRIISLQPNLVILDIMLPGKDGFAVCREIRPHFHGGVLILTALDEDLDQILALELGADDFVIKPVRPRLLLARVRALIRRMNRAPEDNDIKAITHGDLRVEPKSREAFLGHQPIPLTSIEFDLIWFLIKHAGRVVSRNDIHQALYNTDYDGLDRTVDVYISRIRQKLGDDPASPSYLKTVRGVGYLLAGESR